MAVSEQQNLRSELGEAPIPGLLLRLSCPSVLGLLALSICQLADMIFVGRFVGLSGVGGIAVVLPVALLFGAVGRGLGVGGASIITRALGKGCPRRGSLVFGQIVLVWFLSSLILCLLGFALADPLLSALGGQGGIFPFSRQYLQLLLPGLPFLSFAMLCSSVIRGESMANRAMLMMGVAAVVNVMLDFIFIVVAGWGMKGAALATSVAYLSGACLGFWHFIGGSSALIFKLRPLTFRWPILKDVIAMGLTPLACQGMAVVAAIVINRTLFLFGGELAVASYCVVQRLYVFVLFPLIGVSQGFLPICGYSYGAGNAARITSLVRYSIRLVILLATCLSVAVLAFHEQIAAILTFDPALVAQCSFALRMMVLLLPFVAVQLICSVFFQSLGCAFNSLLLTLLRQGMLLIPLVLVLPHYLGVKGVWYAFPVANFLACIISLCLVSPKWRMLFQQDVGASTKASKKILS